MGTQLPIVPPLPSERELAWALREVVPNAPPEGWTVALTLDREGWRLTADANEVPRYGAEHVPHRGARFDALAAARRLHFAASDALDPRKWS